MDIDTRQRMQKELNRNFMASKAEKPAAANNPLSKLFGGKQKEEKQEDSHESQGPKQTPSDEDEGEDEGEDQEVDLYQNKED